MATTVANYGTLTINDLLRVSNTSIIDFGVENVYGALLLFLQAYNRIVGEQTDTFVEKTTEYVTGTGGPAAMTAVYTDEIGVPDSQKVTGPAIMGFPLRKWGVTLQWTYQWLENNTPQEIATQARAAALADMRALQYALRVAIFTPTNRNSTDRFRANMTIPVKAFANADGFPIPPSPLGFNFDPTTHTHYMGTAGSTLAAADIDALIANVLQHFNGGKLFLYVSQDVEATMTAARLATPSTMPLYSPMYYTQQVAPITQVYTEGALAESQPFNRFTGTYRDANVYIKPWMPFGTLFCFMTGQQKPIAMRIRPSMDASGRYTAQAGGDNGEFRMVFESQGHPLHCQVWERECGFGVQNRIVGAVMTVGSSSYTMPNLTPGSSQYMV